MLGFVDTRQPRPQHDHGRKQQLLLGSGVLCFYRQHPRWQTGTWGPGALPSATFTDKLAAPVLGEVSPLSEEPQLWATLAHSHLSVSFSATQQLLLCTSSNPCPLACFFTRAGFMFLWQPCPFQKEENLHLEPQKHSRLSSLLVGSSPP